MEKVSTIHHLGFNQDEINLSCSIINKFGDGQHPWADSENYHGFAIDYLKKLVEKVRSTKADEKLSDLGKTTLTSIEEKLKNL